ncbi:Glycogen synthase [compost metagenome]
MDLVHFATRIRKPTVVSYHSDIVKQKTLLKLYRPLMYRFLSSVDRIVASSPNYVQSSEVLQDFKEKVSIVPYGLDRNTYPVPTSAKLQEWRSRVGEKFFLFVGALRYYKGIHVLLEAAQATRLPVVIVGGGMLEDELKAQARAASLSNVHFVGKLPDEDKAALLTLCYGLVFPSYLRSESFGISLLEGAMYGKPMISCEIGSGTTYINIADETGLVVPPGDAQALAIAMRSLWEQPVMAAEMGVRAGQRYAETFTADAMIAGYAGIYARIVRI